MKQTLLPALLLIILPALSHADFYSYTDENGVVHLSDTHVSGAVVVMRGNPAPRAAPNALSSMGSQPPASAGRNVESLVKAKANHYGVDSSLLMEIIRAESNFNSYAVSPKGAMGLMQLMPATARRMGVRNSFDPEQNIEGGTRYFRYLLDYFGGNVPLALAAYNAGENAVTRWQSIPPYRETQHYVKKIMKNYGNGTGGVKWGGATIRQNGFASTIPVRPKKPEITRVVSADGTIVFTNLPDQYRGTPQASYD